MAKKDENMWDKTKDKADDMKKMGQKGGQAAEDMWAQLNKKSSKDKSKEQK